VLASLQKLQAQRVLFSVASVTSVISKLREDEVLAPAGEPILKVLSVSLR
jgi:hypothetical protein